jgi:hypothetical protein
MPCETAVGDDAEGWWDGVVVVVVVVWPSGWKQEARDGVWAKNPKPSCHSSVSGTPCEMAAGHDAEGWWDGVLVVVVRLSGWKRKVRGGGLGSHASKFSNTFCCKCHKGEVYFQKQNITSTSGKK